MTELNMGETLWAWVTQTPDGAISLVGVATDLGNMPLIGRSEASIRFAETAARAHGKALDQKVWLRRYTLAEEIGR